VSLTVRLDSWVYRTFGKNWMLRLGSACSIIATGVLSVVPTGPLHRLAVIVIAVGTTLGQLGSIAPAEVKPDLSVPPESR